MTYYNGITHKDVKLKNFGKALIYFKTYLKNTKLKNFIALVTCNRIELYSQDKVKLRNFTFKQGKQAIKHLFKVAAGLDSMLLGENEVSVQVKKAFHDSKDHCSGNLAYIFERAIKTSKKIRAETKINYGRTSIPSIAVETITKKYNPKKVLIVGSGMCAGKIAKALSRKKIKEIILSNRNFKRAKDLAKKVNGKAARLDDLNKLIKKVDVTFSTTSCPIPVIYKKDIPTDKHIILVDLAIPYDIDKEIDKMSNTDITRLEHFKRIINKNLKEKKKELQKAMKIINAEVDKIGTI